VDCLDNIQLIVPKKYQKRILGLSLGRQNLDHNSTVSARLMIPWVDDKYRRTERA
jgi:hypothetical protein